MDEKWIYVAALIPGLLVGVILHEIAHGWVAGYFGDNTARESGRITLNPLKHIDPYLTLLLPGLLIAFGSPIVFGGAKPVPVNPARMRQPRRSMMWVAAAGPATNFLLSGISLLLLLALAPLLQPEADPGLVLSFMALLFLQAFFINLILGIFNLFPVPPLDGSRIVMGFMPDRWVPAWLRLERYGLLLVLLLILSGALDVVFSPIIDLVNRLLQNILE